MLAEKKIYGVIKKEQSPVHISKVTPPAIIITPERQ